jgi:hypothetical protein
MDKKLAVLVAMLAISTGLVFAQAEPSTDDANTEITNTEDNADMNADMNEENAEVQEEGATSGSMAQ